MRASVAAAGPVCTPPGVSSATSSAQRRARSTSWVAISTVVPAARSRSRAASSRSCPSGSSPAVGSSRISTRGRIATAPAIAARLRCPYDSRWVGRSASAAMSSAASASPTRDRTSASDRPRFSGPKDTSCATDAAKSWSSGSCTTSCTVVRNRVSPPRSYRTGSPPRVNRPACGRSPPLSSRISVVLPLPLRPSRASARPSCTAKSRPVSTGGPSSYAKDTPRRATRAVDSVDRSGSFTTGVLPVRG